jgi:rRNA N6-adenosine-methyltransferase METTL5
VFTVLGTTRDDFPVRCFTDALSNQRHVEGMHVVDLGCGTGILGIACALMGSSKVTFIDVDEAALDLLKGNIEKAQVADVANVLCLDVTQDAGLIPCDVVVMNPPFGTRVKGIDMTFLKVYMWPPFCNFTLTHLPPFALQQAARMARVAVYSMHKTSTRNHIAKSVESLGYDSGKPIAQLRYNLDATHKHHKQKSVDIDVDVWCFTKKQ